MNRKTILTLGKSDKIYVKRHFHNLHLSNLIANLKIRLYRLINILEKKLDSLLTKYKYQVFG